MIKRLGMAASAVAIAGLAGSVGPAVGSGGDHHSDAQRTIRVFEITAEQDFVDVGAGGFSLGDELVFSSKLMKDGQQVGHDGGVCTITSVETHESHCVATVLFDGGQITIQGLVSLNSQSFALPITGGSGVYQDAAGELHVQELSQTKAALTFKLID